MDGRGCSLQGYEEGYVRGPTLFDHVTPAMRTYQEEIFGPVLQIVRATTLPEAVERSEEHTSELQSLMRISYAVFCLKKKINRIDLHKYRQTTYSNNNLMHTTTEL